MLGLYLDFPAWVRAMIAIVVLGSGIAMTTYGYLGRPKFDESLDRHGNRSVEVKGDKPYADMAMYCGLAVTALGAVLFTACGTSDAERHGYKF